MINPGGIPKIPGDMEALAGHATSLRGVGSDFASTGEQVNSTWQGLGAVYDAPEVGQLLAATGPVKSLSASVGADIGTVAGALSTYAATVKQIQEQLDALRVQARELVAEAQADKNSEGTLEKVGEFVGIGGDDDEYAERSNELASQVNAQVAAFAEAQRRCANAINALYGGVQYRADDGDGRTEPGEFGFTREQLDTALEQGQELPWGSHAETDTGIVGGVWDGVKMFAGDLGALIGRDPVTGEWSWSTAGTAWKGLGTFALALGTYAMPGGIAFDQTVGIPGFERGQMGDTLLAAGKGLIAYDEWGKGDNARAGGMAGFNILSAIVGTKGAGAALRGIGAGAQASRLGLVSRAGTAMVRGGEFIGRLPTTTDMVRGLANRFPSLRLPNFSGTAHVNVPHHVDTPPVHTGSPHVHTPNVHTPDGPSVRTPDTPNVHTPHPDTPTAPRPGSVGEALHHSGRPDAPASTPPANVHHPDAPAPRQPDAPELHHEPPPHRAPDGPAPHGTAPHHAGDAPGGRHAAPDTPAPAPRDAGSPAAGAHHAPGNETPPAGHTPHENDPSGQRPPQDHTPGGHPPQDHTPGEHSPQDHIPGDHTTGDHTPGHDVPPAHPDAPGAHAPDPHVTHGHLAPSQIEPPRTAADGPPQRTTDLQPPYRGENEGRSAAFPGEHVKYFDEAGREQFRLVVHEGRLYKASDGMPFDTSAGSSVWGGGDSRAIFVMDRHGNLFASNEHQVGVFHHSSFLAGGPVAGAGELKVVNGELKFMSDQSGHYRPAPEYLRQVVSRLEGDGVDVSGIEFGSWGR